jgi:hypothetical protein
MSHAVATGYSTIVVCYLATVRFVAIMIGWGHDLADTP